MILIGTCNWADHRGFYPPELERTSRQKDRLPYYARYFPIVEIDSSWYGIPSPKSTTRWVEQTPDDFRFDIKAFRTLTGHGLPKDRRRKPAPEEERDFELALEPLRDAGKLRAIQYQLPPWATNNDRSRELILAARERHLDDLIAFEFRHHSWYDDGALAETEALTREIGAVLIAVDAPQVGKGTVPPVASVTSSRLAIVRFHGRNARTWYRRTGSSAERFDYLYDRAELEEWKPGLQEMARQAKEVHALMNTNRGNQGPANAYRLAAVLGIELPEPPAQLADDASF